MMWNDVLRRCFRCHPRHLVLRGRGRSLAAPSLEVWNHHHRSSNRGAATNAAAAPPSNRKRVPTWATNNTPSFVLNQQIAELKGDKALHILELYAENERFNHVNFSTALSRFAGYATSNPTSREHRDRLVQDERFQSMLTAIHTELFIAHDSGLQLNRDKLGVRSVATILHSLVKLRLNDTDLTLHLVRSIGEDTETARWIVFSKNGAPQAVASVCWAAAKLNHSVPAVFEQLEAVVSTKQPSTFLRQASPQAISNVCWAAAKLNVTSCPTFFHQVDAVLFTNRHFVAQSSPQSLANTAWAFAKRGYPAPHLFRCLHDPQLVNSDRPGMLPQHLVNLLWACAVAGWTIPAVLDAFDAMLLRADESTVWVPQTIANAAWAYATLAVPLPRRLLAHLGSEHFFHAASSHELAQALWATATLETACPPLCRYVAEHSTFFSAPQSQISSQSIAMMLWSLAVLEWPAQGLVDQLEQDHAASFLAQASPLDRCHVAWACAKQPNDAPHLFAAMEATPLPSTESFSPRQMATTLWAFATLGIPAPNHWVALDVGALVQQGSPQDVAHCVWAYATLPSPQAEQKRLFTTLDSRARWIVQEGTEQTIATCAWACGTLQVYAPAFFAALLSDPASWARGGVAPQVLSNVIWACGTLHIPCPTLVDVLWEQRTSFLEAANAQELGNTLWALALLRLNRDSLLQEMWDHLLARKMDNDSTELANQILHVEAIGRIEGLGLSPIPEELRSTLNSLLPQQPTTPSTSCRRISELLSEIGWEHTLEVYPLDDCKLLSIDMADVNTKIAIEYNGPTHYLKNTAFQETEQENGRTVAKRRLLEGLGWKVISLDWKHDKDYTTDDLQSLKTKLVDAGYSFPTTANDTQPPDSTHS